MLPPDLEKLHKAMNSEFDTLDAVKDSMGYVKDPTGASVTPPDPILTSTPQPPPPPHAPPAGQPAGAVLALPPPPAVVATPVPPSAASSTGFVCSPEVKPPTAPAGERMVCFTGKTGTGKSFLADQLRAKGIIVVDVVDSARGLKSLTTSGFTHYHVMCSGITRNSRKPRPVVQEPLADTLDSNVRLQLIKGGSNHVLHCVWNDTTNPRPSPRLLTTAEFLARFS